MEEKFMITEIIALVLITGAFVVFAGTLLWGDLYTRGIKR
jgi:hypothetical protein